MISRAYATHSAKRHAKSRLATFVGASMAIAMVPATWQLFAQQTDQVQPLTYGPVQEGTTLWRIATETRPTQMTIHQWLQAIVLANPSVFPDGKSAVLPTGVVLTLPSGGHHQIEAAEWVKYGPVKDGETLWRIAFEHRIDDRPMSDWMRQIFRLNPDAFADSNYASLKQGALLVLPAASVDENSAQIAAVKAPVEPQPVQQTPSNTATPLENESATQDSQQSSAYPLAPVVAVLPETEPYYWQWNSQIQAEGRYFFQEGLYPTQSDQQFSLAMETDVYLPWNDEQDAVIFNPFYRKDSVDTERTHFDIRKLKYFHVGDDWEVHVGIDRIFWGVTESLHLVDIVNQTDAVEMPDGEDKLGQPMVRYSTVQDWGTLDVFMLPYFRERTFSGVEGRMRLPLPIAKDALYESGNEQRHMDWAIRWNQIFSDWELSLSGFSGTSREPLMMVNSQDPMQPFVQALYPQIDQLGVDALYLSGDWIWKLETIHRRGQLIEDFTAAVGGFEYTMYGVFESMSDVGFLMEYQYDSRQQEATSFSQNDLFVGARWALNDMDDSHLLAGVVQDLDYSDSRVFIVEGKTRITDSLTANIDMWLFITEELTDPMSFYRQDDFVQFSMTYFF